jgi:hypothetical protein
MTTKGGDDEFAHLHQTAKNAILVNCAAKREVPQLSDEPWFLKKRSIAENAASLLRQLVFDSRRLADEFGTLTSNALVDLIHSKQRATEVHATYLLEDIEIREYIEANKHSKGTRTTAEIQVLSLSGGANLSIKVGVGREVQSLQALESLDLDNVDLDTGVSLEVVSGGVTVGKTNYNLAPQNVPSHDLLRRDQVTVKGTLVIKGITLVLQTHLKLSISDRVALLKDALADVEDKLSLKDNDAYVLIDLMSALDIAFTEEKGFVSTLKKSVPPKDRDCECRLL